jgi:murein DD-endopeptidase MepM/ murein hydrolase activator NlpD
MRIIIALTAFLFLSLNGCVTIASLPEDDAAKLNEDLSFLSTDNKVIKPQPDDYPPGQENNFIWPVQGRLLGTASKEGIKIKASSGTPVVAVKSGVVTYVDEQMRGFGKVVVLKHADGFTSFYGYNSDISVKAGDKVRQGQTIARVGQTGRAEEPQLYFKLLKGEELVNPVYYLK